jgi:hypothetical protein
MLSDVIRVLAVADVNPRVRICKLDVPRFLIAALFEHRVSDLR